MYGRFDGRDFECGAGRLRRRAGGPYEKGGDEERRAHTGVTRARMDSCSYLPSADSAMVWKARRSVSWPPSERWIRRMVMRPFFGSTQPWVPKAPPCPYVPMVWPASSPSGSVDHFQGEAVRGAAHPAYGSMPVVWARHEVRRSRATDSACPGRCHRSASCDRSEADLRRWSRGPIRAQGTRRRRGAWPGRPRGSCRLGAHAVCRSAWHRPSRCARSYRRAERRTNPSCRAAAGSARSMKSSYFWPETDFDDAAEYLDAGAAVAPLRAGLE